MVISEYEEEPENPVLPKLKPRQKKEKFIVKKEKDM